MNALPDFSTHGYQIEKELGHNNLGGRITYLATKINSQKSAVIKQFQFAQLGATWAEYSAYEQEIEVLKKIAHPGIPRYLDAFQTDSGFCMVQEYINAEPAIDRTFSPPDVKKIAIATLKILADLQSLNPPVIHRDIKPENLLIDDNLNVYLVDFGFARIGGGNIAASSVVKGTMGFMPPEQMFNRELTKASDLYGLGITLICLLTGTKSADVGNLIDANYSIHFRHLVPPLQQGWMNWLERMVAPRIQDRYPSAADALTALESLDVSRLPKVRVERDRLKFKATEYGEILTRTLAISNPIPDTILTGRWEVAPHPNDPPHTPYDHAWISFEPPSFEGNELECQIAVDTSKLLASKIYQRQIVLRANSEPDTYQIAIQVQTARLPDAKPTLSLSKNRLFFMLVFIFIGWLLGYEIDPLFLSMFLISPLVNGFIAAEKTLYAEVNGTEINWFGAVSGASLGITAMSVLTIAFSSFFKIDLGDNLSKIIPLLACFMASALVGASAGSVASSWTLTLWGLAVLGLTFISCLALGLDFGMSQSIYLIILILFASFCWLVVYNLAKPGISDRIKKGFLKQDAVTLAFLTAGFCISLGTALQLIFKLAMNINSVELMELLIVGGITISPVAITAIPLLNLIAFKRNKIIANYHKSRSNLVKP
ncbi:MAG: serine/threonine protein kinase [Richelia sp. CSU_2_1]|nr:serine/threonine protein kinase [Richelia sp. CSU_2_1]